MKPIAKFGEFPFDVNGISVFAATDKDALPITGELFIVNERSTRVFDLVDEDKEIYTFKSMVSRDKNNVQLPLTATASEIQSLLGKNQFVVKLYDLDTGDVLGYVYKIFTNKFILSNGSEVQVVDFNLQTSEPVPDPIPVQSITLNKSTGAGIPGGTETLIPTVLPADATDKSVTWSTSSAAVATVSTAGLVTLVGNGTATITATTVDGAKTASCTYTVTTPVSGVTMTPATLTLEVGNTSQLTTTVAPSTASNTNVSYVSSVPAVASVSSTGEVTALTTGTTTITVTTEDGAKTASTDVTVE